MGRRFVDMRWIAQRMKRKDERYNTDLKRRREEAAVTDRLALAPPTAKELPSPEVVSKVLLGGDLSQLTPAQKISYYRSLCDSLGLNPLTQPFEYLRLSGREVLYAKRNCTDQLRHRYGISVQIVARELVEDCYVVTARASFPDGRHDESIGAVPIAGLKGESRANAMMKGETKSKRRVTLSLVGLSTLDESEVESIPGAQPVPIDPIPPVPARRQERVEGVPPTEPDRAAPADLTSVPESWKPFVEKGEPLTGSILDVKTESKAGKKSGHNYTKTTITLWPTDKLITDIVELYTLDLAIGAQAIACKEAGERVTITAKETPRGHEVLTLQVATDAAF